MFYSPPPPPPVRTQGALTKKNRFFHTDCTHGMPIYVPVFSLTRPIVSVAEPSPSPQALIGPLSPSGHKPVYVPANQTRCYSSIWQRICWRTGASRAAVLNLTCTGYYEYCYTNDHHVSSRRQKERYPWSIGLLRAIAGSHTDVAGGKGRVLVLAYAACTWNLHGLLQEWNQWLSAPPKSTRRSEMVLCMF